MLLYEEIKIYIEGEDNLTDAELTIDIERAVQALEQELPELPKGATWKVEY